MKRMRLVTFLLQEKSYFSVTGKKLLTYVINESNIISVKQVYS